MHTQTQVTLLERVREASDPLAWEEFYERYWRLIFATARRRGCSDHTAEEIVQEAMLAASSDGRRAPADRVRPRAVDAPAKVAANFITEPFEATVLVDGRPASRGLAAPRPRQSRRRRDRLLRHP